MQIGMIGLGQVGANMVRRLMKYGHECVIRWTLQAALEETVPTEVISRALYTRFRSRQPHTFAEKVLSPLRQKFGGHVVPRGPD